MLLAVMFSPGGKRLFEAGLEEALGSQLSARSGYAQGFNLSVLHGLIEWGLRCHCQVKPVLDPAQAAWLRDLPLLGSVSKTLGPEGESRAAFSCLL